MPRRKAPVLTAAAVSHWLSTAGFPCHRHGRPGYQTAIRPDGSVEVHHRGRYGQYLAPGPSMRAWGRRLALAGYTVAVDEDTHLLVTLPDGAASGAPHAVERAA